MAIPDYEARLDSVMMGMAEVAPALVEDWALVKMELKRLRLGRAAEIAEAEERAVKPWRECAERTTLYYCDTLCEEDVGYPRCRRKYPDCVVGCARALLDKAGGEDK